MAEEPPGAAARKGHFVRTDEAIAAAVMYTANHLDVKAIVALTESARPRCGCRGSAPTSRSTRSRATATQRRVTLYRGVYPIDFDVVHTAPEACTGRSSNA